MAEEAPPPSPPIACVSTAFTLEQRARYRALTDALAPEIREVRETEGGFAFRLSAEAGACLRAMEFVTLERLCCPFLTFRIEIPPAGDSLTLTLSGPPGTKEVLADELPWPATRQRGR